MANSSFKSSTIAPRLPNALPTQLFRNAAPRHLQAGEALFVAGDPGDGCYRLEQGLLKVVITSPQGDERILAMLGPGTIVGELAMIDGLPRSSSIFAVKDCELSFISREEFENRTKQHPEVYRYLANVLAARLRGTDEAVAAVSFLTVKERLARALIELGEFLGEADDAGRVVICHKISQSDLAALAGVARENVSRVMSDWKRRKVVTRSGGYYCLDAVETLKSNLVPEGDPGTITATNSSHMISSDGLINAGAPGPLDPTVQMRRPGDPVPTVTLIRCTCVVPSGDLTSKVKTSTPTKSARER